jgi:hypothetical protein
LFLADRDLGEQPDWDKDTDEMIAIARHVYQVSMAELLDMTRKDGPIWIQRGRAKLWALANKPEVRQG